MREILLVSHGSFAKGVYEAIKIITGDVENVSYVCLREDMDSESFKKEMSMTLEKLSNSEQILVFADLQGGSPYTSALELLQKYNLLKKTYVITGINLILILDAVLDKRIFTEDDINYLIEKGRKGIQCFQILKDDDDDDEF